MNGIKHFISFNEGFKWYKVRPVMLASEDSK